MNSLIRYIKCFISIASLSFLPLTVAAATISYESSALGANQWLYRYTVSAALDEPRIDEFTIFFDHQLYKDLVVVDAPSNWDPLVIQPDVAIPAAGFFDALALFSGIEPGSTQGSFGVSFEFLGAGAPGRQRFDIVDPATFQLVASGLTTALPASEIPEPATLILACLGFALLAGSRLRCEQPKESREPLVTGQMIHEV